MQAIVRFRVVLIIVNEILCYGWALYLLKLKPRFQFMDEGYHICLELQPKSIVLQQMRHFEILQEKIRKMESRHQQREQQLQQLLHQNHLLAAEEVAEEAAKWKKVVESKTKEIDRFRNELDSILDVLRVLQRQGVVIPHTGRTAYPENSVYQ